MDLMPDDFKFIDVPSDGDCFYHSVLEYSTLLGRFNGVQELRQYLKNAVEYLYYKDYVLQFLFPIKEKMLHCGAQT